MKEIKKEPIILSVDCSYDDCSYDVNLMIKEIIQKGGTIISVTPKKFSTIGNRLYTETVSIIYMI